MELVSSALPLVKDRGEWNQQTFIIRPKFEKHTHGSIDNQLEIEFPVHRDFDFVANHALGFKGKGNVDLFKFYYRLYLKNKFVIQKNRKEKKHKDQKKQEMKQQINQTDAPNTEELRNAYKTIQIKPPSQQKQLKFVRECIQTLTNQASILNKHIELPKIKQVQTKIKVVTLDSSKIPQAKTLDQQLELEELMLSRVVQAIQQSQHVSHEEIKQVREIIIRRQEQLSEIERQLQLNQILSIKKQIYDREQALKNEQNKPPGIDNPDNFNELSSIQEISLIKSMQFRSQPNVSVTEYRFNNYEDEEDEESKKETNQTQQKKQGEETLMQEQSTEIQSILQQVRSTSIVAKGETEHSTTNDKQTNTKILPTLKFLEQAKQQIAQRSDNESQQLPQPYFQPDYEDSSNLSKMQKSISMVSHLHNKTSKTIKSSQNRSNLIQSSSSNQVSQDKKQTEPLSHDKKYTETLSLEKKQTETMRKSAYSKSPDELEYFEPQQNYYDMKFSQILQRVIEQKKQQGGEDSQLSQTLSVVESETVQRITQNLVANIINMHKNPSPVFDQPSTFNMLDIDSDDQEKASKSIPVLNEQESVDVQRHLSYNRDIAHLDHTFKVESQISLSEKKLNEEQIANIIQQISQQLQQAQIPQDQIARQLENVTNALLRHPINKLSSKLLKQNSIINNEPFKKLYMEETKYPLQMPKQQRKKDIDYLQFYEENAPLKKEKSKKSQKLNDNSKRSKKSALLKLSEEERKQFLDSHKMNLQQRANSEEMDEELQFLQSIIDDEKKKKDQMFKQRQSQPLESGKNTSRDQIDINDQSEKGSNTFRSHNPPLNINYESDQIKQGQTDINFNLRKQQKQKTDQFNQGQLSKNTLSNLASKSNPSQGNSNSRHGPESKQSNNQQSNNNTQRTQQSKSKRTQNEKQEQPSLQDYKSDQESQKMHSPNQSVEEIQAEDEQSQEEEFYEEVQQQIDENGNEVNVVTTKRRQQTERSKKVTERSKQSKQSKQNPENEENQENQEKVENIENQEINEEKPQGEEQEQQQKQKTEQPQQQQPTNQTQNIQQQSSEETKLIKLNFQRQESNPTFSEQASTPQINQQQAKNRTNLSDIQLKAYQQSSNQSNTNTPQQNNTPLQGPPNRGGKTKKTAKFEDNNSNNNTPQARLQRVKTKLSRFQEAANNDEDEYDYDWDEEEQSNKKKKITSKSSKSTLRNDVQSPSISPQTKQQNQQAQIAKKKVYDLKQEYELIARQNLSLAELKREIEKKITQLQNPDDEAKYNIYLYEQRQKQLKNLGNSIEGLITDKRENEDACGDTIRKFHENRMRYKDVIDKDQSLKFTGQIHLDDEQQTQINTQSHLDEYMKEVQMNIQRMIQQVQLEQMRDHPEVRKECFDFDSSILQQRKQESLQSEIVQTQAQMKIYEEPTAETKRQINYSEIDTVISQQTDRKFELLAQKLRNLKQKNPQKFTQIVNTEIVKQELYLETTKHKYILE